jgi:hypothetical protein
VIATLFDWLEARWAGATTRRLVASALVVTFLGALGLIELARRGLLPELLARAAGTSHFHAVQAAFNLLLAYEVLGLVFGIARSVSNAAGKQLEIFSLILLRQSFDAFGHLGEPLARAQVTAAALPMLSDSAGALAIFVTLGFYYRLQRHHPLSPDLRDRGSFIVAKKAIALLLLATFAVIGGRAGFGELFRGESHRFFEAFYTLLVFADILVVLISMRFSSTYRVVFRNSGLAVSTVLLRLALSAPPFVNALLGLAAALFALALTVAYNAFAPPVGPAPSAGD